MRRHAVMSALSAFAALALCAPTAAAQGFGVYEHDACEMGRAGTGVAAPCTAASAIFFNPAGMVRSGGSRWNVSFGGTMISPKFTFQDAGSGGTTDGVSNTIPVPSLYVSRQMSDRWALGIGLYAPYGLVSEWPTSFSGRFLAYRSDLKTVYIQPTAAYKVNDWLSVGGGVTYVRAIVDLKQRVDLSSQAAAPGVTFASLGVPLGTDFADAALHGTSGSAAGHVGVLIQPTRRISLGARYLLRQVADIQGDAMFTQLPTGIILPAGNPLGRPAGTLMDSVVAPQFRTGGALVTQHASVRIPLPDQLVVGLAVRPVDKLQVLFDVQYVNWSRFSVLNLVFANLGARPQFEDYGNTYGYRVGAEYTVSDAFTLRGGLLKHDAAAPPQTVTPLLPEAERAEMTLGGSIRVRHNLNLDVAYQRIWQADRLGRVVDVPARGPAGASVNSGLYGGSANLFGASLAWRF